MTPETARDEPAESRMRDIFRELVARQDAGVDVDGSREFVAEAFAVSVDTVKQAEVLGIAAGWPPLE